MPWSLPWYAFENVFNIGQGCVDRDFCSALQNSGKKCDVELKELCPVYCGLCPGIWICTYSKLWWWDNVASSFFKCFSFIIDDDEVPLPRGGARRHGEQRHTKGSCCSKSLYFDIQKLKVLFKKK